MSTVSSVEPESTQITSYSYSVSCLSIIVSTSSNKAPPFFVGITILTSIISPFF